jgi:hypothetical protein
MRFIIAAATVLALAIAASSTQAHHGWSNYDATKKITITGPILKTGYSNPHATINMSHESAEWVIVLAPVSRMESRGATSDKVKAGAQVSVTGYPDKNGAKELRAEFITIDGKDVQLR